MSERALYKDQTAKTEAVEKYATKKNDTGSPEVWRWLRSAASCLIT